MSLAVRWGDPNNPEEPSGYIYLDASEINEDKNVGRLFGQSQQLRMLGWIGKDNSGKKVYVLCCSLCKEDPELFGDGLFTTSLSNLEKGRIPCGCSKKPTWSEYQYITLLKRELVGSPYTVLGISCEYKGAKTTVDFMCTEHGLWRNNGNAVFNGQRCPVCANQKRVANLINHNTKPDSYFTELLFSRGEHPVGTRLKKIDDRLWEYYCPICDEEFKMYYSTLSNGGKSCNCSKFNPKQAYIRVMKDNDTVLGIKFGVSNFSPKRDYKKTHLHYETLSVWSFPSRTQCLAAERECKKSFTCGIIPKSLMPDGYTETTFVYNLDNIVNIYRDFGGVEL